MVATAPLQLREVNDTYRTLRSHFDAYFDRGWLAMLIDELNIDFTTIRDIRVMLTRHAIYAEDLREIAYGVAQLKAFCKELRRQLLPVIRDRLGVSGLSRARRGMDAAERVQRELLCYVFPHNLARLEELASRLEELATHSRHPMSA
jgi:hypothetical protein